MNQLRTFVLDQAQGPRAQVRTGTVTAASTNSLTVDVAGTSVPAAFLRDSDIVVGDLVALLEQGGSWLALGAIAGIGFNAVLNPSFEDELANWTVYQVTGVSAAVVQGPTTFAVDGSFYLEVQTTSASAVSMVYSAPIPVTVGDQYNVSSYVWGSYDPNSAPDADTELRALWFANDSDLYPTTSSADSVIATLADVPARPPLSTISGTVTAPVTGYMRVALRSALTPTGTLSYDLVIAREVT